MYGLNYAKEQAESKPKSADDQNGRGPGPRVNTNTPTSAPTPAPPSTPRPQPSSGTSISGTAAPFGGAATSKSPGDLRAQVRTPTSSTSGPTSAGGPVTPSVTSPGQPSAHQASAQKSTGPTTTNPMNPSPQSSHPLAYYSVSGIAHARASHPIQSPLASRTRSPLATVAQRDEESPSRSASPAPFTPTLSAPQPPASPAQPTTSATQTPTSSTSAGLPGPMLRHGPLSLPLPTPSPHASHSSQGQSLPLLSLGAFGYSVSSASGGGAQTSPGTIVSPRHAPSGAASNAHFSPQQDGTHDTPSGPPTPTPASTQRHSTQEQQQQHGHAPNRLYLPNIWMGDPDWRQPQMSNNDFYAFPSMVGRRDAGGSGGGGSAGARARWKEHDVSGSGVNGFISGPSSATSPPPPQLNGLNPFGQVNGINGNIGNPLSHTTSPNASLEPSPSPAPGVFTGPTPNGGDGKEFNPFAYEYDRYRKERPKSREMSPANRDPFRGRPAIASSSSMEHQPQSSEPGHSSYSHFGPSSSHHAQSQPHHAQSSSTHFSGTTPFSFNSAPVDPGVDGYVPVGMRPIPPRLTPGLSQGHTGYGEANSSYSHTAYGHASHPHRQHQGHPSYTSWSGIYPASNPFIVPEVSDGVLNLAGPNPMGNIGNVGSSSGVYRPTDDFRHNWTPTPPPLSGAAAAGPSTGGEADHNMGRQPRRTVSAPSVPKPKPQRRFPCPDCSEAFTRRNDLVRHRRKHTGEKPFSCPVCGQAFARKDKLLMHVQRAEQCTARAPPRAPRGRVRRDVSANSTN